MKWVYKINSVNRRLTLSLQQSHYKEQLNKTSFLCKNKGKLANAGLLSQNKGDSANNTVFTHIILPLTQFIYKACWRAHDDTAAF